MSDSDISSSVATPAAADPAQPQEEASPAPPPAAAMEETAANPNPKATSVNPINFSIWPPSQRTRDAVVARLIETLSAPSVLSKRYGTIPKEDAADAARAIEEEAFNAAGGSSPSSPDDDGIEILQIYSKEISKRMLDSVKARSAGKEAGTEARGAAAEPVASEEATAVEKAASEVQAET